MSSSRNISIFLSLVSDILCISSISKKTSFAALRCEKPASYSSTFLSSYISPAQLGSGRPHQAKKFISASFKRGQTKKKSRKDFSSNVVRAS